MCRRVTFISDNWAFDQLPGWSARHAGDKWQHCAAETVGAVTEGGGWESWGRHEWVSENRWRRARGLGILFPSGINMGSVSGSEKSHTNAAVHILQLVYTYTVIQAGLDAQNWSSQFHITNHTLKTGLAPWVWVIPRRTFGIHAWANKTSVTGNTEVSMNGYKRDLAWVCFSIKDHGY